jgi:hypothetical protein
LGIRTALVKPLAANKSPKLSKDSWYSSPGSPDIHLKSVHPLEAKKAEQSMDSLIFNPESPLSSRISEPVKMKFFGGWILCESINLSDWSSTAIKVIICAKLQ